MKNIAKKAFGIAMYGLQQIKEFKDEVTSPEFQEAIANAIKSGALKGIEILSAPINPEMYAQARPALAIQKKPTHSKI